MFDTLWPERLDCERRCHNISGDQARVLLELWRCCIRGDDMPSEARLADLAGVSRSTVQRSKRTGRSLGLLEWERQWHTQDGMRRERPCSYRVQVPALPCVRRERQVAARSVSRSKQQQLTMLPAPSAAMLKLWSERRERIAMGHKG